MATIADTKTTVLLIINADVTNDTDDTYKYYLGLAETFKHLKIDTETIYRLLIINKKIV